MNPSVLHHALVAFLIIVFPIWDRREARHLKTTTDPRAKANSYRKTIAWQMIVTAFLLLTLSPVMLFRAPVGIEATGLHTGRMLLPILIGLSSGIVIPMVMSVLKPDHQANPVKQLEAISYFLPRTSLQKMWFAAMCVTVGVCEELIFRGFLIRYAAALPFGPGWGASSLIAALIFGIDHGYQGWIGIISTTVLALVFTLLLVATGSLLVPMIIHVLIDLRILVMVRHRA